MRRTQQGPRQWPASAIAMRGGREFPRARGTRQLQIPSVSRDKETGRCSQGAAALIRRSATRGCVHVSVAPICQDHTTFRACSLFESKFRHRNHTPSNNLIPNHLPQIPHPAQIPRKIPFTNSENISFPHIQNHLTPFHPAPATLILHPRIAKYPQDDLQRTPRPAGQHNPPPR